MRMREFGSAGTMVRKYITLFDRQWPTFFQIQWVRQNILNIFQENREILLRMREWKFWLEHAQ